MVPPHTGAPRGSHSQEGGFRTNVQPSSRWDVQAALTDARDESRPGRVSVQKCSCDSMTLYHNEGTPIGMNDCVASRLRFDHYGSQHVSKLVTSGVSTDRQLSRSALVACGPMCDSSACSLTKVRAPNRGAPKDPERRRATANFNHVATDVCGPINPSSSGCKHCYRTSGRRPRVLTATAGGLCSHLK